MLLHESNYTRKAQRVDLPLLVQIDGKAYKTKDWSLAGIGILDLGVDFQKERAIDCRLIIPLEQSSFVIPARIILKNRRGNVTGCIFDDLSDKNRRILRRFIELAIEGQLDNVEDLVAVYTEPAFETPITEALALDEKEAAQIKRDFVKKTLGFLFVGIVAALVIGYTAVYNLQYKIFSTGVVTGSFLKITANNAGILDRFHVGLHDRVDSGLVLFDLLVDETVTRPVIPVPPGPYFGKGGGEAHRSPSSALLGPLKERLAAKRREYADATRLYQDRLITLKDLNIVSSSYMRAKVELGREQERVRRQKESALSKEKRSGSEGQTAVASVVVPTLKRRMANTSGWVYRIESGEGAFVRADETVMVIQSDEKPYVVLKLHSRDIYKVKVNDEARIYSSYNDAFHRGKVTQIGYAAVNADATISQETSLNESLVKIEFVDEHVAFPLNSRVEVRIKRDWFQG